ncbi:MAG: imidazoleglycerol-phosphate dehydratase HisB [Chloroflexi bacterium]|nr:imidazoleglycerol-phosphate dehydratase HisB [Chloroflexota bacterium]
MTERIATVRRETKETVVKAEWKVDGTGQYDISTGIRMLDHMLAQLAQHGIFDIKVSATGNDVHHVVEDVGICLGKAFQRALGEKLGITRFGHAIVPMDDSLALVAVDIGGRPYAAIQATFTGRDIGGLPVELVQHFMVSLATEARINLHIRILEGTDDHHKAEAIFKALGRALDIATRIDSRLDGRVPSTKEVIER